MILGKEQRICSKGKGEISQVLKKDFRGTSVVNATFDYQPVFCRVWVGVGTNSTFGKENVTTQNALHKLFDKQNQGNLIPFWIFDFKFWIKKELLVIAISTPSVANIF
jgi:hypothetical protein